VSRLSRFEAYRYIGIRDTMRFYDCDDDEQFDEVASRIKDEGLLSKNLVQVFAPDTPIEARNRGFRPAVAEL
jgi:hypothetical protein